jgi:hypothetical protein
MLITQASLLTVQEYWTFSEMLEQNYVSGMTEMKAYS